MAKLVEVLARELKYWPEGCVSVTQDEGGPIYGWLTKGAKFRDYGWYSPASKDCGMTEIEIDDPERASDYKRAIVTRTMWQSERDRQKGGEWKRHRGGKCPVPAGTKVSTRHRDGKVVDVHFHTATTGSGPATMNAIWKHTGDEYDIMAYRVLEKPEQEEKKLEAAEPVSIDQFVADNVAAFNSDWHFGQIDGPLKWRDGVTELEAYIEEFTRQRDELVKQLEGEGFSLIPHNATTQGFSDQADMQDWRNWKAGDIISSLKDYEGQFSSGSLYEVTDCKDGYVEILADECGEPNGWGANKFKFIRRP